MLLRFVTYNSAWLLEKAPATIFSYEPNSRITC
jgi:hypothetical protein